jgi:hypothetical protein
LKSVCANEPRAPNTIAAVASAARGIAKSLACSGYSGSTSRRKPYAPSFSSTPARIIEPPVGASVCASGSHVWKGQMGTFTANAMTKAQKTMIFTVSIGIPSSGS